MKLRFLAHRRLALAFLMGTCFVSTLVAQSDSGRARIALYEPAGQKEDAALAAVLSAVADSVELSLTVLQRYDVRRLPPVDPAQDLQKVRAYCKTNRIDQAILGSGSARPLNDFGKHGVSKRAGGRGWCSHLMCSFC